MPDIGAAVAVKIDGVFQIIRRQELCQLHCTGPGTVHVGELDAALVENFQRQQKFCNKLLLAATDISLRRQYSNRVARIRGAAEIGELAETFNHMAGDIEQYVERLKQAASENRELFLGSIRMLAAAIDEKDPYTRGHSGRVAKYSTVIAQEMGMSAEELDKLKISALLHDVGKIGVRNDKLNKPGKLTPEELAMFRSHPAKGKRILEPIPFMRDIVPGCYCHHEAWDGSGYPQGLVGDHIPLIGRIVAIADAYDAMTSDRAYRKALPHEIACGELERCTGVQFDPEIVPVFLAQIEDYRRLEAAAGRLIPR